MNHPSRLVAALLAGAALSIAAAPATFAATAAGALTAIQPGFNPAHYTAIYVAPTKVHMTTGEYKDVDNDDIHAMAATLHDQFVKALAANHKMASAPGAGVLTLHLTLTGLVGSKPGASTLSRVSPVGLAMSAAKTAANKPAMFTGSVTYRASLSDGATGKVLATASAKQTPPAMNITSGMGKLTAANLGAEQGAKQFAESLGAIHG